MKLEVAAAEKEIAKTKKQVLLFLKKLKYVPMDGTKLTVAPLRKLASVTICYARLYHLHFFQIEKPAILQ